MSNELDSEEESIDFYEESDEQEEAIASASDLQECDRCRWQCGHDWSCPVFDKFTKRNFKKSWLKGAVSSHKIISVDRGIFSATTHMTFFALVTVENDPTPRQLFFPMLRNKAVQELEAVTKTSIDLPSQASELELDSWLTEHFSRAILYESQVQALVISFDDNNHPRDVIHSNHIMYERLLQFCKISTLAVELAKAPLLDGRQVWEYQQFLQCIVNTIENNITMRWDASTKLKTKSCKFRNSYNRKRLQSQADSCGVLQVDEPGEKAVMCNGLNRFVYFLENWLYRPETSTFNSDLHRFMLAVVSNSWKSIADASSTLRLHVPSTWDFDVFNVIGLGIGAIVAQKLCQDQTHDAVVGLVHPLWGGFCQFVKGYIAFASNYNVTGGKYTAFRDGLMLLGEQFPFFRQFAFDAAVRSRKGDMVASSEPCVFATLGSSVGRSNGCFDIPAWKRTYRVERTGVRRVPLDRSTLGIINDHFWYKDDASLEKMYKMTGSNEFELQMRKLFNDTPKYVIADAPFLGLPITFHSKGKTCLVHTGAGITAPKRLAESNKVVVFVSLGMNESFKTSSFLPVVATVEKHPGVTVYRVVIDEKAFTDETALKNNLQTQLSRIPDIEIWYLHIACHGATYQSLTYKLQSEEEEKDYGDVDITEYFSRFNAHVVSLVPVCRAGAGAQNLSYSNSLLCELHANYFIASCTMSQQDGFVTQLVDALFKDELKNPAKALYTAQCKFLQETTQIDRAVATFFNCFCAPTVTESTSQ